MGEILVTGVFRKAMAALPKEVKASKKEKQTFNRMGQKREQMARDKAQGDRLRGMGHDSFGFKPKDK
jgi:hypothetical protein